MATFCMKCGAEVPEGVKFCMKCGTPVGQAPIQQQPTYQPQQPYYSQTQPMLGGMNTKLILGIVLAVVAIVIILLVVFLVLGGVDSRFVGEWEDQYGTKLEFCSDSTFNIGGTEVGTWEVKNDQVCFKAKTGIEGTGWDDCWDFKFSDNGKTLKLTKGLYSSTFTKK